jgi:hypothetical protein
MEEYVFVEKNGPPGEIADTTDQETKKKRYNGYVLAFVREKYMESRKKDGNTGNTKEQKNSKRPTIEQKSKDKYSLPIILY